MRICIVAEGCYPYVVGGVSSWIHNLILSFPEYEFVILSIVADRSFRGKFVYKLPENVSEVHELYLQDKDYGSRKRLRKPKLSQQEYKALRSLVMGEKVRWEQIFELFQRPELSIEELLMGEDFLRAVQESCRKDYPDIAFSDYLWTMRSVYLPLFFTLQMKVPRADLYHCIVTGYAGVLGSMAKYFYGSRLLISEHGIYTREREEEIIKAEWVKGEYKEIWIRQFKKMSALAYERGDVVTSLYEHARELQIELGCAAKKTKITPNGIMVESLLDIPGKRPEDCGRINIGAVIRVTPIKDVKTMLQAFAYARRQDERLKLWIMGPWEEDREYAQECFEMVELMQIPDVVFTGRINVTDYLGRMDMTILTSISEGQPLAILESFAAKKPVIATDVGSCKGLIYGESDGFGEAGILAHIMNIEEISEAILRLAKDEELREKMGENGFKRLMDKYKLSDMQRTYQELYRQLL